MSTEVTNNLTTLATSVLPDEIGSGVLVIRGREGLETIVLDYDKVEYIKMVIENMSKPPKETTIEELLKEMGERR